MQLVACCLRILGDGIQASVKACFWGCLLEVTAKGDATVGSRADLADIRPRIINSFWEDWNQTTLTTWRVVHQRTIKKFWKIGRKCIFWIVYHQNLHLTYPFSLAVRFHFTENVAGSREHYTPNNEFKKKKKKSGCSAYTCCLGVKYHLKA